MLGDLPGPDLVACAQAGDRDAFAVLVDRHYALLLNSCARMLGDRELARDAAQEATVRALLGLCSLRDPDRFGAWLIGIGLNVCRGWLTGSDRRAGGADARAADGPAPSCAGDSTFDQVAANELSSRVRAAIAALPSGQREAVVRFYLVGLTQAEIATELNTGSGAVKTRLNKARHALRRSLQNTYEEHIEMSDDAASPQSADGDELVPVRVSGLRRTAGTEPGAEVHIVFLESDDGRRLPIWIGSAEATAMALVLEKVELPRPGVYQFTAALVAGAGRQVVEVRLMDLAANVFYAQVRLDDGTTIDARPSDAITLALLVDAPIAVRATVFAEAERAAAARPELASQAEAATEDERVIAAEALARYGAVLAKLED